MKLVDGVLQFDETEERDNVYSATYIYFGEANQKLREHFAQRTCVNCKYLKRPETEMEADYCNKYSLNFSYPEYEGIDATKFYCQAFEKKE